MPVSLSPLTRMFLSNRQARIEARERMLAGRVTERQYAYQLRQVSGRIHRIVTRLAPGGKLTDLSALTTALNRYADILTPWAKNVASRMVADVSKRDATAWEAHGKIIGRALRREIATAPTGEVMRRLVDEQVLKITSIPRDAADRLFKLTTEAMFRGARAKEIANAIMASSDVAASHARMLARTGISTTATALTQARAEHIGSEGYIWRTSRDGAVRPSHRAMEGKFVRWDDPPTLDHYTAHCGQFANCRCYCEPVVPNRLTGR